MKKEKIDFKAFDELINNGIIPSDINEKAALVRGVLYVNKLGPNFVAQILYVARIDNFNNDETVWEKWVTDTFEYSKDHRCHLNLIGKMLVGMKEKYPECYERLITLVFDSNLAIAALYRDKGPLDTKRFLAAHVEDMTREEVRAAVDLCLNKKKEKKENPFKVEQPELPGFRQCIQNISNNLKSLNSKTIIQSYNPALAEETVGVGINCLKIVMDYYKESGEYAKISVEDLNRIEAFSNKIYKQFSAWREEVCAKEMKNAG